MPRPSQSRHKPSQLRHQPSPTQTDEGDAKEGRMLNRSEVKTMKRSGSVWAVLIAVILYSSYTVYRYQFQNMPQPLSAAQAGERAFSEERALKHIESLTRIGPHPVGSHALDLAFNYVLQAAQKIKQGRDPDFDLEVEKFHVKSGANRLQTGLFKGKTLVYSDLNHIILRISPKHSLNTEETSILISSHIDSVISSSGAGDCSSCVATMLELARAISLSRHSFKHAIIFLFNTGEEEGLNGAHSFITQHPLSSTIRMAIDLEAMGIGGKSSVFQTNHHFPIERFALTAKHPSGNIISQDLFHSGIITSATDFQIYREIANLSGLDFAFTDHTSVYHTKNDKLELLKPGSIQHLGENMLSFLLHTASSPELTTPDKEASVYFDILGTYMVVYRQRFASTLYNSVIFQSILIWATSLIMGGSSGFIAFLLSCFSLVLMWVFSLSFSGLVAVLLPLFCSSPVPYIAHPWISIGLFVSPSLIGAFCGQHIGYLVLCKYLLKDATKGSFGKLEAERWLFKSGFLPWLILLIMGNYYNFGSTYLVLTWLVPPAFAYGIIEATLVPSRRPKPMKLATLMMGLSIPILISVGTFIRLAETLIGIVVRIDKNPGNSPEWIGNLIVGGFISIFLCLTVIYVLSYMHLFVPKMVFYMLIGLFCSSVLLVKYDVFPPFTENVARTVNIVHVIDANENEPTSFILLYSNMPGNLEAEVSAIGEGFGCRRNVSLDFVSFSVKYACLANDDVEDKRVQSEIPEMNVIGEKMSDEEVTLVSIDTRSSVRWCLAINTKKIGSFSLKGGSEVFVEYGNASDVDGWHLIQFSGGRDAPTVFQLTLFWVAGQRWKEDGSTLLKLRTDVNALTPKVERIMKKLPVWCSAFGKSTAPFSLAFLKNLRL